MNTAAEIEHAKDKRLNAITPLCLEGKQRSFFVSIRPNSRAADLWSGGYRYPALMILSNESMELWGSLDQDEIEALRDKCNEILAACEEPASQPEAQEAA